MTLIWADFFFGCDDDLIGPETVSVVDDDSIPLVNAYDSENCDCENGMTQITLQYVGEQTASKILGFYSVMNTAETPLKDCEFLDVQNGDTITCSAGAYGTFKKKTRFEVYYDGDDEDEADCIGDAKTKCLKPIIGDSLKNCYDLVVVSHIDGDGSFCDANVLSADIAILKSNAFVDNRRLTTDSFRVWKGLDLWIRWMLICLFIAFSVLISVSCFLCGLQRRTQAKRTAKEEELDDIMKHIALQKWREKVNGEIEVRRSLVQHIAMSLRRRHTWGANNHTVVHTHQAISTTSIDLDVLETPHVMPITSPQSVMESFDEHRDMTEDENSAHEDAYYFDEENIPTVMHHEDDTNCEYAD